MQHLAAALLIIFERIIVLLEVFGLDGQNIVWGNGHHYWPTMGGVQIDEVGLTMNGLCMVSRGEALFYLEELRFSQKNQL